MSMNYNYNTKKGAIRVGSIVGLNTYTFAAKYLTFNILEERITFGPYIEVDRSKALVNFVEPYFGNVSVFNINGSAVENISFGSYVGIGTISVDIFSRNYDFKYKGKGVISLNDDKKLTITQGFRSPYNAKGLFNVYGRSGESFNPTPYEATGSVNIYGNSLTKEIAVYGYYGDDKSPGTSGTITISQQTLLTEERKTNSYLGSGSLASIVSSKLTRSYSYNGTGNISISGSSFESSSIVSESNTQLFVFSDVSNNSLSIKVPESTVTLNSSGEARHQFNYRYVSIPTEIVVSGSSANKFITSNRNTALFRFVRHNTDNSYDTVDNEFLTSDNQDSAAFKFGVNPVESTALLTLQGNSVTKIISLYSYNGVNQYQLSGSYSNLKFISNNVGVGTLFALSSYDQTNVRNYVGLGSGLNIFGLSQSSITKSIPLNTVLYNISGVGKTKIESDYQFNVIGLININGSGSSRKISIYSKVGIGSFNLYGELTHPNIRFIPATVSGGFVNISGSSEESITKVYTETLGTLFSFCFGLESFSKSTYVGIGSIYVQEVSSSTLNNPYQIPRTYVSII